MGVANASQAGKKRIAANLKRALDMILLLAFAQVVVLASSPQASASVNQEPQEMIALKPSLVESGAVETEFASTIAAIVILGILVLTVKKKTHAQQTAQCMEIVYRVSASALQDSTTRFVIVSVLTGVAKEIVRVMESAKKESAFAFKDMLVMTALVRP